MKQLTCEVCGSTDLIKDGGVFVCQFCGCKYTIEEVKKMMVEGIVEVTGTVKVDNKEQIENMLVNARRSYEDGRYKEAQTLYQQVLASDPNNVESILYEGISAGWQGNLVKYTMQQATDATLRALQIAGNNSGKPEELEEFVLKGLLEITELGKAVVSLCEKSTQEAVKRGERELESVKRYSDQAGLYADFDWIRQRGDNAIATLEADEKRYGEIKDNTYLLVLSVYEEVLKIFKDVEKYELKTFDKMAQKLNECKIDKNAYYKMTVNKYQNVVELIQKKRKANEDYFRKLEEARVKQYWEEHKEEKISLDIKLEEFYDKKDVLIRANAEYEKFIKLLQKEKLREIPLEKELAILKEEKNNLIAKKSGLIFFKGKEKTVLDEEIGAKEEEIYLLSEKVNSQKAIIQSDCDSKISCIKKEKKNSEKQLNQIEQNIEEIQNILSAANSESYTENVKRVINKITETYTDDESFTQIKAKAEAYRLEREHKEEVHRLEDKHKQEADRLEKERKAEIARKEAERIAKRNKKIAIITTPIVCAIIAFVIVLNIVIIPNVKYNDAIALMDAGKLDEAYSAFIELGDYKDASDKAGDIGLQKIIKNIKVGNYVNFGAYEQDNNTSNGKEDVEWIVLEIKDGKALVISKYALDCKKYNASHTDVTWETCTLRKWLNNDFINAAFSADEKAMIPTVTVSADKNPDYSTNPGNATQDQVFLLSITEANKYFKSNSARQCKPTDYAVANGAWENDSGDCLYWLRSPGPAQDCAAVVDSTGDVYEAGYYVHTTYNVVRPALWIDLNY